MADYVELAKNIYKLDVEVLVDTKRMRPSEVPLLIGRNDKIYNETGWRPSRSILDIIKEGVEYFQKHPEMLGIEAH